MASAKARRRIKKKKQEVLSIFSLGKITRM